MSDKKPILLWIVVSLVALACLADIGTFIYFILNNSASFESNPIFILLSKYMSVLWASIIIIIYKLSVNAAILWFLIKYKPTKGHTLAYMLTFLAIFTIVLQGFGAYSNVATHSLIQNAPENVTIKPLSEEQSFKLFSTAAQIYEVLLILNLIIFMIYERIFCADRFIKPIRPLKV